MLLFAGVSSKQRFRRQVFVASFKARFDDVTGGGLDARARLSRLPHCRWKTHTDSASPTAPQPFWLGLIILCDSELFLGQANCLFEKQTENSDGIWKRRAIVVIGYPPPNYYLACSFYASLTANDWARESY